MSGNAMMRAMMNRAVDRAWPVDPGFGPRPNSGSGPTGAPAGNSAGGTTTDDMIVLKVDADKLPSASDLKAHLFASTLSVTVSDPEIRVVTRGAFPDLSLPHGTGLCRVDDALSETVLRRATAAPGWSASGTRRPPHPRPTAPPAVGRGGPSRRMMQGGRGGGQRRPSS